MIGTFGEHLVSSNFPQKDETKRPSNQKSVRKYEVCDQDLDGRTRAFSCGEKRN